MGKKEMPKFIKRFIKVTRLSRKRTGSGSKDVLKSARARLTPKSPQIAPDAPTLIFDIPKKTLVREPITPENKNTNK